MTKMPHPDVIPQLEAIPLEYGRPLLICDADDVLFHFLPGFAAFLVGRGLYFDWTDYSLDGTIRHAEDERAVALEEAGALLNEFFGHVENLEPIEGGADYNHLSVRSAAAIILDRLAGRYQ